MSRTQANEITAAKAGQRLGFAGKSRAGLRRRPGVAELVRRDHQLNEQMKTPFWPVALLTLLGIFNFSALGQSTTTSLAQAANKAMAEGKDGTLNVGFARVLGLKAEQPLPLKRIQTENDGATNVLNVLRENTNTIILYERRQHITTFYLTDRSGTLKRAVVNDGAIANGGLTNLTLKAAASDFEKQKKIWLQQTAR
jgi:hypothetical protein